MAIHRFGWLYLSIILIGLLFEVAKPMDDIYFPDGVDWFPLLDKTIAFSSWVYYLAEHAIELLIVITLYIEIVEARVYTMIYGYLALFDMFDYIMIGNAEWFNINGWPVSFNVIKVMLFALFLACEFYRTHTSG